MSFFSDNAEGSVRSPTKEFERCSPRPADAGQGEAPWRSQLSPLHSTIQPGWMTRPASRAAVAVSGSARYGSAGSFGHGHWWFTMRPKTSSALSQHLNHNWPALTRETPGAALRPPTAGDLEDGKAIEDLFGLVIRCGCHGGYRRFLSGGVQVERPTGRTT